MLCKMIDLIIRWASPIFIWLLENIKIDFWLVMMMNVSMVVMMMDMVHLWSISFFISKCINTIIFKHC